jgi:hypothetical protein
MRAAQSPVLEAEQRAWRYWFSDGVTNLIVGISILLMAFCILYPPHWPPSPLALAAWAAALFGYVSLMIRHQTVVEWLKARTTYPRTGYVQSPCPEADLVKGLQRGPEVEQPEEVRHFRSARRMRAIFKLALILAASVAMIVFHSRWVFTAAGIIVAVAMWIARRDYRLSWIVPAGFPLVGLCVSLFVVSRHQAPAYFLAGWGLLFLLDGGVTLIRYTLQNPAPETPQA